MFVGESSDDVVMTTPNASTRTGSLRSISDAQHGLLTVAQARQLLGSASAAFELGATGEWERLSRTLYRRIGSEPTFQQRCLAAVLSHGGDAVVSHETALALFEARFADHVADAVGDLVERAKDRNASIHVSSTTGRRGGRFALVHRVAVLPDRWRTIQRGVPVVAPALVTMQLFATEPVEVAGAAADALVRSGLTSYEDLSSVVAELGERGRAGTGALRSFLVDHFGDPA